MEKDVHINENWSVRISNESLLVTNFKDNHWNGDIVINKDNIDDQDKLKQARGILMDENLSNENALHLLRKILI